MARMNEIYKDQQIGPEYFNLDAEEKYNVKLMPMYFNRIFVNLEYI